MKKIRMNRKSISAVLGAIFFSFTVNSSSSFAALPFEVAFHSYYVDGKYAPTTYSDEFRYSRRYLFISGFTVEEVKGDFLDQKETLKNLGIPPSFIHHLKTPSMCSSEVYVCARLYNELLKIMNKGDEKWVVIAHSIGGLEFLKTFLRHSDKFMDQIESIVFVQVPFGGTPLADHSKEEARSSVQYASIFGVEVPILRLSNFIQRSVFPSIVSQGMYQLETDLTQDIWGHVQNNLDREKINFLEEKTHYVRAWKPSKEVTDKLRSSAQLVSKVCEKNDGVVCLDAQRLPFGRDLGILNVDHMELETQLKKSGSFFLRDSFMLALLDVL